MNFCEDDFLLGCGGENVMMESICADILAEAVCM